MATPTIKSTYSLDVGTRAALEKLAARLSTSKSDVIRRAVKAMEQSEPQGDAVKRKLAALKQAQKGLAKRGVNVARWARGSRDVWR